MASLCLAVMACEPDKVTEDLSTITYYPVITMTGEKWAVVRAGTQYVDPGVTAKEGDSDIEVKVTGSVDVSTPGVYVLRYVAENKDGYSSVDYRYVGVISDAAWGGDISGTYKRNAGAFGVSKVTRIKDNLYQTDNVGGVAAPSAADAVFFFYYDKGRIGAPYQLTQGNAFECTNSSVKEGVSYSWVVVNPNFGPALRTFEKQ